MRLSLRTFGALVLLVPAALPLVAFLRADPVSSTRALVMLLAGLSAIKPGPAFLVCGAFIPIAGVVAPLSGSPVDLAEPMVLAFLAGWLCNLAAVRREPEENTDRFSAPIWLLAAVVVASCAVQLIVLQVHVDYPWRFVGAVFRFLHQDYFRSDGTFGVITTAYGWLEALGLALAGARLVARDREFGRRALAMMTVGAAAVAALSVYRLFEASLRTGQPWSALRSFLTTIRVSVAFPDYNAAGSYFVMALPIAVAFTLASKRGRAIWAATAGLIASGVWLTGSRAAVVASGLTVFLILPRRIRVYGVVLSVAGVLAFAAGVLLPGTSESFKEGQTRASAAFALRVRAEMARVALKVFEEDPVFGVGLGAFRAHSGEHVAEWLRPAMPDENAHNNFLQLLAELGLVGFLPFAWLFVMLGPRSLRAPAQEDPVVLGAEIGFLAFAATCLAGHPLLITQVRLAFWSFVGVLAGTAAHEDRRGSDAAASPSSPARRRPANMALAAAVLLLVASVPVRGQSALAHANLMTAAIGFSPWQHPDGEAIFRRLAGRGQFHVPTDVSYVQLPVRTASARLRDLELEIRLDGRLAYRVSVPRSGAWKNVGIVLDKDWTGRLYRSIELLVMGGEGEAASVRENLLLDVGRPSFLWQPKATSR